MKNIILDTITLLLMVVAVFSFGMFLYGIMP